MMGWRATRLIILLALLAVLAACGGDGNDAGSSGGNSSTGTVYIETSASLVQIDLAERQALEAYHFQQRSGKRAVVAVGERLAYADVVRSGDGWLPALYVIDRATGAEEAVIEFDPVPDSLLKNEVVAGGEPRFFPSSVNVWYVPGPHLIAVATTVAGPQTTTYRLDLVDANDLSVRRTIGLGETPGRGGGISMALDSSGNVAVLVGNGRVNRLLASSDRRLSFQPAGPAGDCGPGSTSSTARALRRYFLCYEPGLKASLLVFDESGAVVRRQLPGEFSDPLFGAADAGRSVFVGNVREVTVIEFDLVSQQVVAEQVVAERRITRQEGSSFLERFKRFLFGSPVFAIQVVRQPVAVSLDEQYVFFTDRWSVYCLSAETLEVIGQTEFDSVRALAAWNQYAFFAAGETTLHVIDPATCEKRDSIEIPFDTDGAPTRIFVP